MALYGQIGKRLLFWFLIIAIVPLAIIGVRGYVLARRAVIKEVFLHMEAVAGHKRTHVEEWLTERLTDLDKLAHDKRIPKGLVDSLSGASKTNLMESFQSYTGENEEFNQLFMQRMNGQIMFNTNKLSSLDSLVRPDNWTSTYSKGNEFKISPVKYDPVMGTYLYIAESYNRGFLEPEGWLIARLPLSRSLDHILLDSTGLGKSGHAYLINHENMMLTHSRHLGHPEPGTHKMSSKAINQALSGHTGVGIYTGWKGRPALGAWTFIPSTGWALIAEMDQSEALSELEHLKKSWLIVFLLTVASILIIVAILARSISKPILELTHTAEKLTEGNLSARTGITQSDEIGVLGSTFDRMGEALIQSQQKLEESYQKLIQAEKQLVKSESLAAIGEIVASVVHELRNPLSAVKMNLNIINRKQTQDSPIYKNIMTAQNQVLKLEKMLSEILDYAKPVELKRRPIDLTSLIDEILANLADEIRNNDIEVKLQLEDELPIIIGDSDLLTQALNNLIHNSIEAMNSLEKRELKIIASKTGHENQIQIEISDTGIGLNETQIKRIFEPFFTTRKTGTGLGLPNTRKVIELHQGHLEIKSAENKGTNARIVIPIGDIDA